MSRFTEKLYAGIAQDLVLTIISRIDAVDVQALVEGRVQPEEFFRGGDGVDPAAINQLVHIANMFRDKIDEVITYPEMVKQARKHRQDLLNVIGTPEGKAWMEKYLYLTREYLKHGTIEHCR